MHNKVIEKPLIILQPIDFCNLNCSYCYLPGRRNKERMSFLLLDQIIQKIENSECINNPMISWHAGEPLTAGLDFFEYALSSFSKASISGKVSHQIQTNGTLLNQKWLSLFKEYNVDVGLSVDGPQHVHDRNRVNWAQQGSHRKVQEAIQLLKENDFPLQAIAVLTDYSLDFSEEIFNYFLENGFSKLAVNADELIGFHDSSSIYEPTEQQSLKINKYKKFMERFFELWFKNRDQIEVREFTNLVKRMAFIRELGFDMDTNINKPLRVITIDREGNLYTFSPELTAGTPEDPKKFCVGNIFSIEDFDEILLNKNFQDIYENIRKGIDKCKDTCNYFDVCRGGSPANKFYETKSFAVSQTAHCNMHTKTIVDILVSNLE